MPVRSLNAAYLQLIRDNILACTYGSVHWCIRDNLQSPR
nr:MAG TPA: hypothetical protein [Caudoviricetes sp.]